MLSLRPSLGCQLTSFSRFVNPQAAGFAQRSMSNLQPRYLDIWILWTSCTLLGLPRFCELFSWAAHRCLCGSAFDTRTIKCLMVQWECQSLGMLLLPLKAHATWFFFSITIFLQLTRWILGMRILRHVWPGFVRASVCFSYLWRHMRRDFYFNYHFSPINEMNIGMGNPRHVWPGFARAPVCFKGKRRHMRRDFYFNHHFSPINEMNIGMGLPRHVWPGFRQGAYILECPVEVL